MMNVGTMRILLLFGLGLLLATTGCNRRDRDRQYFGEVRRESQSVELDKAEKLNVELRMGVGELRVKGGSAKLLDADFTFDNPSMRPVVSYKPGTLHGELTVKAPPGTNISAGRYEWALRFNDALPTNFVLNMGTGNAEMDLGTLTLRDLDIRMGVGNLDLDLRGTPTHDYDVQVKGGIGNAKIHLPAQTNIIADAKGGIGHIEGHNLVKRDGQWVSKTSDAKVTVHLDIQGGIGNIELIAE